MSRTVTRMRLPAGVCFSALPTKFSTICVMRTGSASIHTGSSASSMRPAANPRAATSASTQRCTARSSSSGLHVQDQLVRRHAADVEQVVDEPREVLRLTPDARDERCDLALAVLARVQHRGRGADGGQRVAQLVAQNGEELVLGAGRRVGIGSRGALALEQRATLDGERRHRQHRHRHRHEERLQHEQRFVRRRHHERAAAGHRSRRRDDREQRDGRRERARPEPQRAPDERRQAEKRQADNAPARDERT